MLDYQPALYTAFNAIHFCRSVQNSTCIYLRTDEDVVVVIRHKDSKFTE
jgi:hypothetical protein